MRDPATIRSTLEATLIAADILPTRRNGIIDKVFARLDKGADEYGELQYLEQDNLHEVIEECLDVLGWGALEIDRRKETGEPLPEGLAEAMECGARALVALR
jgi:hypothetical protein